MFKNVYSMLPSINDVFPRREGGREGASPKVDFVIKLT